MAYSVWYERGRITDSFRFFYQPWAISHTRFGCLCIDPMNIFVAQGA